MGSHPNCTLQIKLIQLRLRCSDEKIASWFKEIKSFKMKVNRKYQQLWCSWKTWIFTHGSKKICATKFLSGSVSFLLKTRLLKSNLCSRRNMSSNTEIGSSYWQVSIFFWKIGFFDSSSKRPVFEAAIFPHDYEAQPKYWWSKVRLWLGNCIWWPIAMSWNCKKFLRVLD